jgi:small subunit ribosomal protein S2
MILMSETQLQSNYEDMLKAGMHFGRKRTVFNPGMGKYVFTVRNGVCIIDLLKTKSEIGNASKFLDETIKGGGLVLFVGLTKQSADAVKDLADHVKMPYVIDRWLGGTLTNFKVLSGRVKKLEEMEKQKKSGELDKYTKKEKLMYERELMKMKRNFDGLKKLTRLPDVVFVTSLKESALPIREAKITNVKVVAIANTDASPKGIECVIPANDRSKKSVDLIVGTIKDKLQ